MPGADFPPEDALEALELPSYTALLPKSRCSTSGRNSAHILVDPFADSHGVDTAQVLETVRDVVELEFIESIERVENADDIALCQVADVIGFSLFRSEMGKRGHIGPDVDLDRIVNRQKPKPFNSANIEHIIGRKYPNLATIGLVIHYAMARNRVVEYDPKFAETYLISVEEFYRRAKTEESQRTGGILVLKDPTVAEIE